MTGQSRLFSAIESLTNVLVGYALAVSTQMLVFPWFGLPARLGDAIWIGMVFTVVSLARSYILRRVFNGWGRA